MKEYKKLLNRWLLTNIAITWSILSVALIVAIIGAIKEDYLLVIACNVSLFVVWYLLRELLDYFKPIPPLWNPTYTIKPIPPRKEDNNELTDNNKRQ